MFNFNQTNKKVEGFSFNNNNNNNIFGPKPENTPSKSIFLNVAPAIQGVTCKRNWENTKDNGNPYNANKSYNSNANKPKTGMFQNITHRGNDNRSRSPTPKNTNQTYIEPKPTFPIELLNNPNIPFNKKILEDFKAEFIKRDQKINALEAQVKLLNQGLAMCMKLINGNQKQNQPINITFAGQNQPNNQNFTNFGKVLFKSDIETVYQDNQFTAHITGNQNMQQVQDLKIENNFGKILFKESVNISQINIPLSKWALISNKNVEVLAQELKNKKCEIQIFNFMDYLSCKEPQQIQKIFDTIQMAKMSNKIEEIQFDSTSGTLYIKSKGF